MNILIIGEYSAFAKHLKDGFIKLGHQVMIVQNGDGFKQIPSSPDDYRYTIKYLSLFGHRFIHSHVLFNHQINKEIEKRIVCRFPDKIHLIIVISYGFLYENSWRSTGISLPFLQKMLDKGPKLVMSCCGTDPAFRLIKKEMCLAMGESPNTCNKRNKRFDFLIKHSHVIIPVTKDYKVSISGYCKMSSLRANISRTVPLPMTVIPEIKQNSCIGRKIVIFHGINRPQAKGTPFIVEAMNRLAETHKEQVTCIAKGKMPYEEYCALFQDIDILIDQTYSDGMGINAAIGLMNGKVVLGGNSKESEDEIGYGKCPIINIEPDADQIYSVLVELIQDPKKIEQIKKESRKYALTYLDSKKIAQRYIDLAFNQQ